jgi:hypothetical protein
MEHNTKNIVECVAAELKTLYCDHRSRMQKVDFTLKDKKWNMYFMKAATVCVAGCYNPAEFMEVQFFINKPWPSVQVACSDNAEARFAERRRDYAQTIVVSVEVQTQMFEELAKLNDVRDILTNDSYEFDKLFIHIVATIYQLDDIVEMTSDGALLEYMTSTHYDRVYTTALPEWLKERSHSIRSALNGGR